MRRRSTACRHLLALLPLFTCLPALVGCTSPQEEQAERVENSNLLALVPMLRAYVTTHGGRYPSDEEDLREFIKSRGKNPDELLVSSRDGKPLVVVYQDDRRTVKRNIMAYEQEGKDGTRMSVDELGSITPLTEEEFRQAVPQG